MGWLIVIRSDNWQQFFDVVIRHVLFRAQAFFTARSDITLHRPAKMVQTGQRHADDSYTLGSIMCFKVYHVVVVIPLDLLLYRLNSSTHRFSLPESISSDSDNISPSAFVYDT